MYSPTPHIYTMMDYVLLDCHSFKGGQVLVLTDHLFSNALLITCRIPNYFHTGIEVEKETTHK